MKPNQLWPLTLNNTKIQKLEMWHDVLNCHESHFDLTFWRKKQENSKKTKKNLFVESN